MSQRDAIDVEVEIVLHEARRDCLVVVRPLSTPVPNFAVTAHTTIGGARVQALEMPPRMCGTDGVPRLDLLAFRVRRHDSRELAPGARVLLAGLRLLDA